MTSCAILEDHSDMCKLVDAEYTIFITTCASLHIRNREDPCEGCFVRSVVRHQNTARTHEWKIKSLRPHHTGDQSTAPWLRKASLHTADWCWRWGQGQPIVSIFQAFATAPNWSLKHTKALPNGASGSAEHSFAKWLRGGEGIFWISGKAGSGKSTLVKCVLSNRRTTDMFSDHVWGKRPVVEFILRVFSFTAGEPPCWNRSWACSCLSCGKSYVVFQDWYPWPCLIATMAVFPARTSPHGLDMILSRLSGLSLNK